MVKITDTAQKVLEERYYVGDESKWEHLVRRVAGHFSDSDSEYGLFINDMMNMDWLPNSPVLMNAGTDIKAYSACYVLPVEDNIESIYKFYSDAALISKSGGGVGANYSAIRGRNSTVQSTGGVASGPLSFIKVQDISTDVIKQGGRRRGANMGILNVDHPDIWEFISAKDTAGEYENFNFSVGITDEFMETVTDPHHITVNGKMEVDEDDLVDIALWDEIIRRAHSSAEPGVLFIDTIEAGNTVPHLGKLEATNPCGEQPLLPYESCSLASINLSNHITAIPKFVVADTMQAEDIGDILPTKIWTVIDPRVEVVGETIVVDWEKLRESTHNVVLFMNRVLDKSEMPIPECQEAMEATKKIGIGIMGLHDMLIQLGLAYDSEEGRELAESVMKFVAEECNVKSVELGDTEGDYTACVFDTVQDKFLGPQRRNANLTTIAPTGTLSMIADCSSGCEPYYTCDTVYKTVLDGTEFAMHNPQVARLMLENPELDAGDVLNTFGSIMKGAEDIHWRDHILMQACLQKHVDSSISKTINMPADATVDEVREAYELAWREGLKGVTVYRDGSRGAGVLSSSSNDSGVVSEEVSVKHLCTKADIPVQLHAVRYKVKVDKAKVYILVCEDENGLPVEVFAKFPYAQDGNWDSLCRSLSLSLRYGVPIEDVVSQLEKSVRVLNDTPSHLARILKSYIKSELECSECGGKVIYTEGCEKCLSCGLSKCN